MHVGSDALLLEHDLLGYGLPLEHTLLLEYALFLEHGLLERGLRELVHDLFHILPHQHACQHAAGCLHDLHPQRFSSALNMARRHRRCECHCAFLAISAATKTSFLNAIGDQRMTAAAPFVDKATVFVSHARSYSFHTLCEVVEHKNTNNNSPDIL